MKEDILPEGWEKTKLGKYLYLKNGYAFKKTDYVEKSEHSYPIIRISDINNFTATDKNSIHTNYIAKGFELEKNDLLIAMSGATTGKVGVYKGNIPAYQNQRVGNLKLIGKGDSQFRNYLMLSLQELIEKLAYGGAQPNISGKIIEDIDINLPPLPEQQYLSKKLTALLDEVAQTKQRLEAIPALLKQFRQSVLADAVSGKLTEENFEPENLKKLAETDVIIKTGPFGSALHKEEYISDGIPVINPIHISNGNIIPSSEMSISQDKFSKLSRWQLKKDEVILGRRGEMGRAAVIVENMLPMLCGTGSIVLSSRQILSKYLALILRSPTAVNFFNQSSVGSTMVNLNQKIIKELEVYIPPKKQQTQIVQKVETYFALADEIETQVNAALENVNLLTQSILAKAFSGELSAAWRKENSQLIQIRDNNE